MNGDLEVTFVIENKQHIRTIKQLNTEDDYSIDISKLNAKRSLQQNKYMWALLAEIAKEANGDTDEWNVYLMALEEYSQNFEYVLAPAAALNLLEQSFRAVKVMNDKVEMNGNVFTSYKCFGGSSKMNTKEMNVLIDGILAMAVGCGIDTAYWEEVLK